MKKLLIIIVLLNSVILGMEIVQQAALDESLTHIIYFCLHQKLDATHKISLNLTDKEFDVLGLKVAHQIFAKTKNIHAIMKVLNNWSEVADGKYRFAIEKGLLKIPLSRVERVRLAYDCALESSQESYVKKLCTHIIGLITASIDDDNSLDFRDIAAVFNHEDNVPNKYLLDHLPLIPFFKDVILCSKKRPSLQDLIFLGQIFSLLERNYAFSMAMQENPKFEQKYLHHREPVLLKLYAIDCYSDQLEPKYRDIIAMRLAELATGKKDLQLGLECLSFMNILKKVPQDKARQIVSALDKSTDTVRKSP